MSGEQIVVILIAILVLLEWQYRARKDGEGKATMAMVYAGSVFAYLAYATPLILDSFGNMGIVVFIVGLLAVLLWPGILRFWPRREKNVLRSH